MSISRGHSCAFKLFFLKLNLFGGFSLGVDNFFFFLFSCHELILSNSKELSSLGKVLSQSLVLESKVIQLPFHVLVLSFCHVTIFIAFEDIALSLELVIFLVQEINLIRELLDSLFILLVLVMKVDFLQILNWLVEIVKPQNFIVSNLYFLGEFSRELLFILDLYLECPEHLMVLLTPLISFTNFLSPLVLINQDGLLHLNSSGNGWWAIVHFGAFIFHISNFLNSVSHINALLIPLEKVVSAILIKSTQPINNLILARKINLFKRFLHLRFQLDVLSINFLNSHILWVNQELEILAFFLKLTQGLLPFELTSISLFLDLDYFMMELIVLLRELFILLL